VNTVARYALIISLSLLPQAHADELGRLFFTPSERKQLEHQHTLKGGNENDNSGQSVITVNGVIKRSDGSRIVWINGQAQNLSPGRDPNKIPVIVPGKKKPVEVKVGERLYLDTPVPNNTEPPGTSDNEQP
jgi:hypothetical protein